MDWFVGTVSCVQQRGRIVDTRVNDVSMVSLRTELL